MADEKIVYTVDEAGKLLRISRRSAYKGVKSGDIPTIRVGNRILVPVAALNRILETAGTKCC